MPQSKNYFVREADYVCDPSSLYIKMTYITANSTINVAFYDTSVKCFDLNYHMFMTKNRDDYDDMLNFVLDASLNKLTKDEFQELMLNGNLLGLSFYRSLKTVRNRSGKLVWTR